MFSSSFGVGVERNRVMEDLVLQELLKRAGEISKVVPESLREAAFNRAVDVLLGNVAAPKKASVRDQATDFTRSQESLPDTAKPADYLLARLDRTAHPEVASARRVLDRAL